MMPVVTLPERPNGLPIAIATSPGRRCAEEASSSGSVSAGTYRGRPRAPRGRWTGPAPTSFAAELVAVLAEADPELAAAVDDVLVGDDVALAVHQEAGAAAAVAVLDERDGRRRRRRRCPTRCRRRRAASAHRGRLAAGRCVTDALGAVERAGDGEHGDDEADRRPPRGR